VRMGEEGYFLKRPSQRRRASDSLLRGSVG
jgi:hypothetical protein